uniref:Uncharacterized protein n=1 Tax=Setaria digitata TaxID=48799 RepID=A0A915PJJ3_9BILA
MTTKPMNSSGRNGKSGNQLTLINDNLTDELIVKSISDNTDYNDNTTTTLLVDIPIIVTTYNFEEIQLLINGPCSMV